jgi:hypothetical protein
MLEYILFHETPFQLFVEYLEKQKVSAKTTIEEQNYEIAIPEDIDDDLLNKIDEKYDELMDMNRNLIDEQEGSDVSNYNVASIILTLKDGTTSHADIDAKLMTKIMEAITPEELNIVVNAIVRSVENPEKRSVCQRIREGEVL